MFYVLDWSLGKCALGDRAAPQLYTIEGCISILPGRSICKNEMYPYRSHLTEIPCYRMWPHDKLGAGSFTVLFQNTSEGETNQLPADFFDLARFTL